MAESFFRQTLEQSYWPIANGCAMYTFSFVGGSVRGCCAANWGRAGLNSTTNCHAYGSQRVPKITHLGGTQCAAATGCIS